MALIANLTTAVNPSEGSIEALAAVPDVDALAMLNVLDFSDVGGRESYARYTAVAGRTVASRGGSVLLSGTVLSSDLGWDSLVIVRYPRRAAYLDMQSDAAYVGAIPDRTAGLARRLLYPFALADDAEPKVHTTAPDIFAVQLVRLASGRASQKPDGWSGSGELLYSLPAGGPAMVADGQWDLMQVWKYSSVGDAEAEAPQRSIDGAEHELTMLIAPDQHVVPSDLV